jgi:hypothetical protein
MSDPSVLGQVALGYSPMIDRHKAITALRLTVFPIRPDAKPEVPALLDTLAAAWPEPAHRVSLNIVGEELLDAVLRTDLPLNMMLEVPAFMASDLACDPPLAFKLMRYINSPAFGLSVEISSFRHAIMILGYQRLKRWLALLLATASKDPNMRPVMFAAVRRGMLMEELAKISGDDEMRNELFICGVFSLLDRMFRQPFSELLKTIPSPRPLNWPDVPAAAPCHAAVQRPAVGPARWRGRCAAAAGRPAPAHQLPQPGGPAAAGL